VANPALIQVTPDLRVSSQETLELTSDMEQQMGTRPNGPSEARQLIRRAEWALSIVSAATVLFSVWVSLILLGRSLNPREPQRSVDHAATGNFEIDFELMGAAKSWNLLKASKN